MRRALWTEKARRDPADPYAWAMTHRSYGGEPPVHMPALADIARDNHPFVVIQKSAQVGVTELLVNRALWAADIGLANRGVVLFLMPAENQMRDFASSRFDQAIQNSAYLRRRLQPEPPRRKSADSQRLKHLGPGYIYLRGADSRRQVASVDADLVIFDEYDQMGEGVLELGQRRISSSRAGSLWVASTPRLPEAGINGLYLQSDQRRYLLPCPDCHLEQALGWDDNVDKDRALVVCRACQSPMDVRVAGRWVAQAPGNEVIHGYHLTRLYSPWANIPAMIEASEEDTLTGLREFYNSDLGEAFTSTDGQLTVDMLDRCRREYALPAGCAEATYMGVDVGKKLHVVIRQPLDEERKTTRAVFVGEVDEFEELTDLIERFSVGAAVIDAQPEQRKALEFARVRGECRIALAYYVRTKAGHVCERDPERDVNIYKTDRTLAIEEMIHSFESGRAQLPDNARQLGGRMKDGLGDYYRQTTALKRVPEEDSVNWVASYANGGKPDHYAHSEVYCALALQWGSSTFPGVSIEPEGRSYRLWGDYRLHDERPSMWR